MTRRRIIAGVILLAAVAVAVPFAPGVWRAVAYEDCFLCDDELVVRWCRWEWLQGRTGYVPNQPCSSCLDGQHDHCWRLAGDVNWHEWGRGPSRHTRLPPDFRCTCTDSSHDGDSE